MARERRGRHTVWLFGVALAAGVLVLTMSGQSTESELRARLERVSLGVRTGPGSTPETRAAELERHFGGVLAREVTVTIPDLPLGSGQAELVRTLAEVLGRYHQTELTLGRSSVRVDRARHRAVVDVEATFQGEGAQGLYVDRRNAVVTFLEQNGQWQIVHVYVADRDRALPEARP
jgi:hypothetical protein